MEYNRNPFRKKNEELTVAFARKTSAEIISEARMAINESQGSDNGTSSISAIKPLQTQRPFTPRDKERHLFGKRTKGDRPASSFSLRYLQNEISNTGNQLFKKSATKRQNSAAISLVEFNDNIFNIGVKDSCKIRLPSLDDAARPLSRRKIFKNTSLEKLPEEIESVEDRQNVAPRNAFSSPKERTDFDESEPFYGPPKQHTMSECLLLGPQNLTKIFDNRYIIENSERLFSSPVARDRQETVEDILKDLNRIDTVNCDEHNVKKLLDELYECMEKERLISSKTNPKIKILILKSLYRFVESKNEIILIGIARIILALNVTGNNLSGVCKLVFKISKNDRNDQLFLDKNLLELFLDALGRCSPIDDSEACVYAYGAVKFLTMNPKILQKVLDLGILPLMVLHIKIINNIKADKVKFPEKSNHVLFQMTGALRNILSDEDVFESFISCGTVNQLCQSLDLFSDDVDVVTNISRILSNASTNDGCCDILDEIEYMYKTVIKLLEKYSENEDIVVRLTYTLGNLVAKIDNSRIKYFKEPNSVDILLSLWKIYLEKTLQLCSLKVENEAVTNSNSEDVMIKVIRVIANVVINPEIGKETNRTYGSNLIDEFLKVLISNPFKKNQELVLSILSTLNNLSYYYSSDLELDIFHVKQIDIVEGIMEYSISKNKECIIESMRILGNLSRSKVTRSYIAETEIFDTLMKLLNSADLTLLKTTIGVFVNLMSDNKCRMLFKENEGVKKLITILNRHCESDWNLGTLVCQVLWNYSIDTVDFYQIYSEGEIQQLLVMLADFLDEEKLFGTDTATEEMEVFVTPEYLLWEEFAAVATNLLEKIEYFLDTFDQIKVNDVDIREKQLKNSGTNISFTAW